MKRAFLVPTAVAISALSQGVNAKAVDTPKINDAKTAGTPVQTDMKLVVKRAALEASGIPLTSYAVGDQLFGFVIDRTEAGKMVADHYSHSSHASHTSHYSGS